MNKILVIAGTDSSGGAGLSRDVAMAQAMECSVSPVVTAVTVQTDAAVCAIHPIPPEIVAAQIDAAFAKTGHPPTAVKIGMLGSAEISDAVAQALPEGLPVVLDPVLKSSSGCTLMTPGNLKPLLRRVTLLTPNLLESALLSGYSESESFEALSMQAQTLRNMGPLAVLIKGGHGTGQLAVDHLFNAQGYRRFASPRLAIQKRGTGCSLASAISCALAKGEDLETACETGKAELLRWLQR